MLPHEIVLHFIQSSLSTPGIAVFAIMLGVLMQEDVTTVAVGMMAADHRIPVPLALGSLVIGTILNDFMLYGLGRFAITHPRLRAWVAHEKRIPLREWLGKRLISTVLTTQFLPGMRLPIFASCGFFALSFRRYALSVIAVVLVWSPLVFGVAYFYGVYALEWFGFWRWPIAFVALLLLGLAARSYWKKMTAGERAVESD
ncbi:MAG TPA: hypothetical protein VII49_12480 [Rhizomicrobium sp.]